jgi:hypothetical protein
VQYGRMLIRVWQQLDCRLDVCRVTKGAHNEQLWACIVNLYNYSFITTSIFTILVNIINFQTAPVTLIHSACTLPVLLVLHEFFETRSTFWHSFDIFILIPCHTAYW